MKTLIPIILFAFCFGCARNPQEEQTIFDENCSDYQNVTYICIEVCGQFWAKKDNDILKLYSNQADCFSGNNQIFQGVAQ